MIVDILKYAEQYYCLNKKMEAAFQFIRDYLKSPFKEGKYMIDGDQVYAIVQSYSTAEEQDKAWEAHRKYIDLQYIAKGKETIYWRPVTEVETMKEYDEEKDFQLLKGGKGNPVEMSEGYFSLLYPHDAHKPGCILEQAQNVVKIVIKIAV